MVLARRRRSESLTPYLYLLPGLAFLSVILLYPVIRGIILGFLNDTAYNSKPGFVGIHNYIQLLKNGVFLESVWHTVWWGLSVLAGEYVLGLVIALLLNRPIRGRVVYRSIVLIPWVMPPALAAIVWEWIYQSQQYGILNSLLISMGIIRQDVAWLANGTTAMWAIIAAGIWQGIPFVAIVLLARLQAIPREEYEAATIEGANAFQCFRYITLAHLRDVSFVVIILSTIWNINQFELTYILTGGGPGNATQVLSTYTYLLFFSAFDFSGASASATVMLLIMMILTGFYIRRVIDPK